MEPELTNEEAEELDNLNHQEHFIQAFNAMCGYALAAAIKKGFQSALFPPSIETNVTRICLMHSELSEMMEGLRMGNPPDRVCPEFSSAEIELADLFIRGMHFAAANRFLLGEAIVARMEWSISMGGNCFDYRK